jgi:tetratricopeptide (TPR) repeat protein
VKSRSPSLCFPFVLAFFLAACGGGVTPIQTAYNKGVYLASAGELTAAIAEYREALLEDPHDLRAMFNLAATLEMQAYRLHGKPAHELGIGERPEAELLREARSLYEAVLTENPQHERATQNLAAMEWEAGEKEASEQRLLAFLERRADLMGPRLALAARALEAGDEQVASDYITQALEIESTHPDALAMWGDLCLRRGEVEAAKAAFQSVLVRRPEDLHALVALGRLEFECDHTVEAESWLRRALFVFPRHGPAHELMADLSEREDRYEEAVKHLWELRSLVLVGESRVELERINERLNNLYSKLAEQ